MNLYVDIRLTYNYSMRSSITLLLSFTYILNIKQTFLFSIDMEMYLFSLRILYLWVIGRGIENKSGEMVVGMLLQRPLHFSAGSSVICHPAYELLYCRYLTDITQLLL